MRLNFWGNTLNNFKKDDYYSVIYNGDDHISCIITNLEFKEDTKQRFEYDLRADIIFQKENSYHRTFNYFFKKELTKIEPHEIIALRLKGFIRK